jgi:acyl-CoA thioester hydrolase
MNMAYYNVILDDAVGDLFRPIGFGPEYRKTRNCSTMTAECHVRYLRELRLGDPVQVFIRLLGADEKRLHFFEEMRHATEGWLATTSENISLHIDMSVRRVAPFPPAMSERIRAVVDAHGKLPLPEGAGQRVGLPVKSVA